MMKMDCLRRSLVSDRWHGRSASRWAPLAGCGESNPLASKTLYPVKGKVTLPDGKPLTAGKARLQGTKIPITNAVPIGSDGTFSRMPRKGCPRGNTRSGSRSAIRVPRRRGRASRSPGKYLDEDTST